MLLVLFSLLTLPPPQVDSTLVGQTDFTQVTKVDNHIHLAAAMTSKHLLSFIRRKLENFGDDIIPSKKYGDITLTFVFFLDNCFGFIFILILILILIFLFLIIFILILFLFSFLVIFLRSLELLSKV